MKPVVIFDFDGTIADTMPHVIDILQGLSTKYGYTKLSTSEIQKLQELSIREIFKIAGIPFYKLPFIVSDVKKMMSEQISLVKPIDGISQEIHTLKESGYSLGLVTSNNREIVLSFLKENDLDIFDYIHTGTTVFGKARAVQKFLEKYSLINDQVIYIGDEIRDIEATQKVKIPIIAVTWGYNSNKGLAKYNPNYLVDKPEILHEVIATVFAGKNV